MHRGSRQSLLKLTTIVCSRSTSPCRTEPHEKARHQVELVAGRMIHMT